jgi:hypothetical protein
MVRKLSTCFMVDVNRAFLCSWLAQCARAIVTSDASTTRSVWIDIHSPVSQQDRLRLPAAGDALDAVSIGIHWGVPVAGYEGPQHDMFAAPARGIVR